MKKALLKYLSIILLLLGVPVFMYCYYMEENANFHTVSEGLLYRSGQVDRYLIEKYAKDLNIHTIVNLRGSNPDRNWYLEEITISRELGIVHIDIEDLSARRYLPPHEIENILHRIILLPKPILIHCSGGADRSGIIAAAWRLRYELDHPSKAFQQLSWRYGHFPYLWPDWKKTRAMDRSFRDYVEYLRNVEGYSYTEINRILQYRSALSPLLIVQKSITPDPALSEDPTGISH